MSSPTLREPEIQVPVTMVPSPLMVNTLSTGSLNIPSRDLSRISRARSAMVSFNAPIFSPVIAETTTTGASPRALPARNSFTSSLTSSTISSSTRSFLVMTTIPLLMPSISHMSICSRVWGITPSSAATTKSTMSIPQAPATICRMNFS